MKRSYKKASNRYLSIGDIASDKKDSEFDPGATSEILLVVDREKPPYPFCILKRIIKSSPELISKPNPLGTLINREAHALRVLDTYVSRLSCRVVKVIDSSDDKHDPYLVTEWASGQSLDTIRSTVPLLAVVNIYINVIKSLKIMHHDMKFIYRDARHEHFFWNALQDPTGEDKASITLIDFGNVYFLESRNREFNPDTIVLPEPVLQTGMIDNSRQAISSPPEEQIG